jgi:(S)-2-hydroxyglutarate dehydrogenase
MESSDIAIIGGGIVGLATALHLTERHPQKSVVVLEKEAELAQHQTGRNSGVLHSGIYYKPGSLKALNCRTGLRSMVEFCREEGVAHEICGKVIVATSEPELERLQRLFERGRENGIRCEIIGPERLRELEPQCAGIRAIHVLDTGIADFKGVCRRMAEKIAERGHRIVTSAKVQSLEEREAECVIGTTAGDFRARYLVNCAGLYSDRVSALSGESPPVKILPFRGEYFELTEAAPALCRNLIYPVPDPRFPFLGVHLTRMIDGGTHCGPNAVLAMAREGYRKTDFNVGEVAEMFSYPGFYRMASRHWRMGFEEMWRSVNKKAFVRALQRLVPEIREEHLKPSPAGVRAQAVARDGALSDDFVIVERRRAVHVLNAPSPAATSALSIGASIAESLAAHFGA